MPSNIVQESNMNNIAQLKVELKRTTTAVLAVCSRVVLFAGGLLIWKVNQQSGINMSL